MLMNLVNYFNTHVKARFDNEKGQGMVEYGLIIALVAIAAIASFSGLATAIGTKLSGIVTEFTK